jgi:hypothetical protein
MNTPLLAKRGNVRIVNELIKAGTNIKSLDKDYPL